MRWTGQNVGEVVQFVNEDLSGCPEAIWGELQDVVSENFMKLSEGNVSEFQKKEGEWNITDRIPTIDEKDRMHQIMTKREPLLEVSRYHTWRIVLITHGQYSCHCLAQTLWDMEELFSTKLPDQNQPVSILVVSAMIAVRWLEATWLEATIPTPKHYAT